MAVSLLPGTVLPRMGARGGVGRSAPTQCTVLAPACLASRAGAARAAPAAMFPPPARSLPPLIPSPPLPSPAAPTPPPVRSGGGSCSWGRGSSAPILRKPGTGTFENNCSGSLVRVRIFCPRKERAKWSGRAEGAEVRVLVPNAWRDPGCAAQLL